VPGLGEKEFYLDEFRGRTLLIAVDREELRTVRSRRRLVAVTSDLVENGSRVVIVLGRSDGRGGAASSDPNLDARASAVRRWLGLPATRARRLKAFPRARGGRRDTLHLAQHGADDDAIAEIWQVLRVRPLCLVVCEEPALAGACAIAARLRVLKLVVIDPLGGLRDKRSRQTLSYLDGPRLDVLLGAGEAEFQGLGDRREILGAIDRVLESGVSSVSLCRLEELARELFTYEGAGTFFSHDDHCRVSRLSVDDFHEVEGLVARGEREGLLKPRSAEEVTELLLDGYGAWLGDGHLAGVGALRMWPHDQGAVGEIIGLYTFTRFKGEGVGDRLVERLLEQATARGASFVFAVTTAEHAARFFERNAFRAVAPERVPAAKWESYDAARRERVRVFRRDLSRGRSQSEAARPAQRSPRASSDHRERPSAG
jgi:N-acetylglutamate synthase-like GNAT family acetyltransferase